MAMQFSGGKWGLLAEKEKQRGLDRRHEDTGDKFLGYLGKTILDLGKTLGTEYFEWKVGGGEEAHEIDEIKAGALQTEAGAKKTTAETGKATQVALVERQAANRRMQRELAGLPPDPVSAAPARAARAYTFPEEGAAPPAPPKGGADLVAQVAAGDKPAPKEKPKKKWELVENADGSTTLKDLGWERSFESWKDAEDYALKTERERATSGVRQAAISAKTAKEEREERRGESKARKANLKNFKKNEEERKALSALVPNDANRKKMDALETEARGMLDGDTLPPGTKLRRFKMKTADSLIKNYFSRRSNPSERAFAVQAAITASADDNIKAFFRVNYGEVTSSNVEAVMLALIHTAQSAPTPKDRKAADELLVSISAQAKDHNIGADVTADQVDINAP